MEYKKGDKIDLNTGYKCDTGTVVSFDGKVITWESVMGGTYKSPVDKYNVTIKQ